MHDAFPCPVILSKRIRTLDRERLIEKIGELLPQEMKDVNRAFHKSLDMDEPWWDVRSYRAAGELDAGITIDFTVRKLLQENPDAPIDFVYPETGVVMVPSPIAIFKDAPDVAGAKTFERYILSQSGQALLRDLAGVVPVRPDVTPPDGIESITQLRVTPADPAWIQAHHEQVLSVYDVLYGER